MLFYCLVSLCCAFFNTSSHGMAQGATTTQPRKPFEYQTIWRCALCKYNNIIDDEQCSRCRIRKIPMLEQYILNTSSDSISWKTASSSLSPIQQSLLEDGFSCDSYSCDCSLCSDSDQESGISLKKNIVLETFNATKKLRPQRSCSPYLKNKKQSPLRYSSH